MNISFYFRKLIILSIFIVLLEFTDWILSFVNHFSDFTLKYLFHPIFTFVLKLFDFHLVCAIISCKKFKANLLLLVINFILLFFIRIIVIIKNINFQFLVKFKKGMKTSYLISMTNFLHVNAISYEKSVLSAFIIFHLKIHH